MAQPTAPEAIRHALWRRAAIALSFAVSLPLMAQKMGEVDLTGEIPAAVNQSVLPEGCEDTRIGVEHADGSIVPGDGGRPKLELEVVSLSDAKPALGEVVQAEITLKNFGKTEFVLPWSTDRNLANRLPEVTRHEYESGWFWIWLKDASGREERLRSLSVPLYSSGRAPRSALKLSPGQWVTIHIKFQFVIGGEGPFRSLNSGPAELRLEWRQGFYTWEHKGCAVETSYSSYDSLYEQKATPVKIFLFSSKDEQARASTQQ